MTNHQTAQLPFWGGWGKENVLQIDNLPRATLLAKCARLLRQRLPSRTKKKISPQIEFPSPPYVLTVSRLGTQVVVVRPQKPPMMRASSGVKLRRLTAAWVVGSALLQWGHGCEALSQRDHVPEGGEVVVFEERCDGGGVLHISHPAGTVRAFLPPDSTGRRADLNCTVSGLASVTSDSKIFRFGQPSLTPVPYPRPVPPHGRGHEHR